MWRVAGGNIARSELAIGGDGMADRLTEATADLVAAAERAAVTPEAAAVLGEARSRLEGPLRVAIAGKVKAGKSTLVNALLGEELAATDAGECTKIVTWYRRGGQPEVVVHPRDAPAESLFYQRRGGALDIDLGRWPATEVDHLEVGWPTQRLRDVTLIDTPGIASISADISERTHRVLAADDDRPPVADAVLYLLRHTHATDVRFLEAFHDDELAHGTPLNAVGVLARADEIGSCRLDALQVAARVGGRYQSEPRLRRLCPVIVPVAGLLAYAGETLREPEYRALAALAGLPNGERGEVLLTADRLAHRETTAAVTEIEREHLLGRLGLFGVRLSVDLIGSGAVASATQLSAELVRRSGLEQLRGVLLRQFTQRSRVLKARSALAALMAVLGQDGCRDADGLRARAEAVMASAHEFEEVRMLDQLRSGDIALDEARIAELERLLGGRGHDTPTRLGLDDGASPEEVRHAATAALSLWQRTAEHPLSSRPVQRAARVATRTLEGLLAGAADG
jgi:hypothetical protein